MTQATHKFYTYAWLRENGTPFYVGKGCGNRAWVKHRNWNPPSKECVLILKKGLTEDEALAHEVYMIFVLGRKFEGGLLHNSSEGGERGYNPSPETREKMGAWQRGVSKPKSAVEKMRESLKALPKPRWYTKDGHNIFIRNEAPPEGYVPGRAKMKDWGPSNRKNRVWWNNGEKEVWRVESPGNEWMKGRKKK